jgi:hypothetical protein
MRVQTAPDAGAALHASIDTVPSKMLASEERVPLAILPCGAGLSVISSEWFGRLTEPLSGRTRVPPRVRPFTFLVIGFSSFSTVTFCNTGFDPLIDLGFDEGNLVFAEPDRSGKLARLDQPVQMRAGVGNALFVPEFSDTK